MTPDDYLEACLRTWADDHPERYQVAHAAMMVADEWNEVCELLDASGPLDMDDLADELGDVLYGLVVLESFAAWPYLPDVSHATRSHVDKSVRLAHDAATKYVFRAGLDYYDQEQLRDSLETEVLCLADCLCGFIRSHGLEPMELAEANADKLSARHGEEG